MAKKLLPLFLLLPLFFILVSNGHDWGDDFAQYLLQARNIIEGRPQIDNGLVYDSQSGPFAIQAYPVGFPLLLAPLVALTQYEIRPLLLLESLILIGIGWMLFLYYSRFYNYIVSILLMLLFAYNPYVLYHKTQVLTEFPFMLFLLFLVALVNKDKRSTGLLLLIGAAAASVMSIRIIGCCVLPALFFHYYFKEKTENKFLRRLFSREFLVTLSAACIIFFILNKVIFRVPLGDFLGFYANAGIAHKIMINETFLLYEKNLDSFFILPQVGSIFWNYTIGILMLGGWILVLLRSKRFEEWFFLFYLLVILFYPYLQGGYRMLLPLFPFMLRYFIEAIHSILKFFRFEPMQPALIILLCMLLVQPFTLLYGTVKAGNNIPEGPQTEHSREMLSYIKDHTRADALIVFCKARALSLYANRHCTYLLKMKNEAQNDSIFQRLHVTHLVRCTDPYNTELNDATLDAYFNANANQYRELWKNDTFSVYERK